MSRIFLVLGLVVAVVFLSNVKDGDIATNDIFGVVGGKGDVAGLVKPVAKKVMEKEAEEEDQEVVEDPEPIQILAFGDMMLGRYVRVLMDKHGMNYPFQNMPKGSEFFKDADIVFGNLEGPIHGKGKKGGTSMVFSFGEDVAPLLKEAGFTLLSLANNHAVDQGWDGRDSTIKAVEAAKLSWCGHPSEAASESVYYGTYKEQKVAFVCFQDITFKLDIEKAVALIKEVRTKVDLLVVSIHWGIEYDNKANQSLQIDNGHKMIDAGADFIIGHHPHVVQNFEIYNGRMIFYSLGNFVFDQYWSKNTQKELAINISFDRAPDGTLKTIVNLLPMKSELSVSRLMSDEEKSSWLEEFIGYGNYDEATKEQIRKGVIESRA